MVTFVGRMMSKRTMGMHSNIVVIGVCVRVRWGCSVRFSSVPKASQVLQAWGQVCDIVCMAACAK